MSENQNPTINLNEHVGNIIFEKKEDETTTARTFTLEEQIVNYSNDVLGIKVQSVALPPNYDPQPKSETQVVDWLRNKIQSRYAFAYQMSLKYGEKLKVKLEQKEPYVLNN